MSDFLNDLNTLRAGVIEARKDAAHRGAQQMKTNPGEAMSHLDIVLAEDRRLEEIDRLLQREMEGDGHRSDAATGTAGATVVKPHARSFGADVPGDKPRVDSVS